MLMMINWKLIKNTSHKIDNKSVMKFKWTVTSIRFYVKGMDDDTLYCIPKKKGQWDWIKIENFYLSITYLEVLTNCLSLHAYFSYKEWGPSSWDMEEQIS